MSDCPPDNAAATALAMDLRAGSESGPPGPERKRFDIFLVDTGWNRPISKMIHSHLPLIYQYQRHDSLYVLSREMSVEILKFDPALIGHDPTLVVFDLHCPGGNDSAKYHGFRLNLGLMKNPGQALARLREFLRFLAVNRSCERLDAEVRRELHREGVEGMIKLLRETSTELLVE
jgi:hypothetical protein